MPKEWTDEEVQEAIRDAVKIVAEDRERAEYERLHGVYGAKPEGDGDKNDGKTPPPKKETPEGNPPKSNGKKRSLWWGESSEDNS